MAVIPKFTSSIIFMNPLRIFRVESSVTRINVMALVSTFRP